MGQLYRWVKASERLPEVPENASGLIIIRESLNHDNYKTSWYSNLKGNRGCNSLLKRYPNKYEWLEPITGESQDEYVNDIKEMAKRYIYDAAVNKLEQDYTIGGAFETELQSKYLLIKK